jgi:hypothetical protein
MKIHHLLGQPSIILTNEEKAFIDNHSPEISIKSLHDREEWLARNLVRKGIYEISNDSQFIILRSDEKNPRKFI